MRQASPPKRCTTYSKPTSSRPRSEWRGTSGESSLAPDPPPTWRQSSLRTSALGSAHGHQRPSKSSSHPPTNNICFSKNDYRVKRPHRLAQSSKSSAIIHVSSDLTSSTSGSMATELLTWPPEYPKLERSLPHTKRSSASSHPPSEE